MRCIWGLLSVFNVHALLLWGRSVTTWDHHGGEGVSPATTNISISSKQICHKRLCIEKDLCHVCRRFYRRLGGRPRLSSFPLSCLCIIYASDKTFCDHLFTKHLLLMAKHIKFEKIIYYFHKYFPIIASATVSYWIVIHWICREDYFQLFYPMRTNIEYPFIVSVFFTTHTFCLYCLIYFTCNLYTRVHLYQRKVNSACVHESYWHCWCLVPGGELGEGFKI